LEKLGCQASESWFVGDDFEADIRGARGAGLRALWYRPSEGDGDISRLAEVASIIG